MPKKSKTPRPTPAQATGEPAENYADLVRYSRDGDQFHYLWAARRLLRLIDSRTKLVAVAIEGVSRRETHDANGIAAGEAVVDVAEYDGDERLAEAEAVRYLQLKHSTQQAHVPWKTADLRGAVEGFAARYEAIVGALSEAVAVRVTFSLVTNRPISADLSESVADLAAGAPPRHRRTAQALARYAKGAPPTFWRAVSLRGDEGRRQLQQEGLQIDVASYLPGPDVHAPLQLKELVVRRALPDAAQDPVVRRMDVFRALGVSPDELFPAPNRITLDTEAVPRQQEVAIARQIAAASQAIIVEAPSGQGKSVLSMRLPDLMPPGSETLIYDCFGAGEYRQRAHPRHRARDALVQIVNELAGRGLCDPLLPSPNADTAAYLRALLSRLRQTVETVRRREPEALVTLIIDAADNAEMGAVEAGDPRSFARDLIREPMPEGVRLVMLCRPERTELLDPPPAALRIPLKPFTLAETTVHLRRFFPDASAADAAEFHRRTSHNPRVQANAIAVGDTVANVLRLLGPDPKSVNETILDQLKAALADVIDAATPRQREQFARLCAGLAILRPLIPIEVLAAVSGASVDAIRSFAIDFGGGRPLMMVGDALQFRDEPVEDWFRLTYRADVAQVSHFIDRLKPLASTSAYVAASLPPMLLEAGRLDELIEIALSSAFLPAGNALQRRDVELQRLQFALRASLRARRRVDAAKLALRLGGEAAGDSRHLKLIQENTDLAGRLLDAGMVQDLVSRRGFTGKWLGARHAYEAALMAENPELIVDARSRLRLAHEWLSNWAALPAEERRRQPVAIAEITELALAALRVHGPVAMVKELSGWRPRDLQYRVTGAVCRRLLDAADLALISDLQDAIADAGELEQGLAAVEELAALAMCPARPLVRMLLRRLPRRRQLGTSDYSGSQREPFGLFSLTCLVPAALRLGVGTRARLAALLDTNLPAEPTRAWANPWSGVRRSRLAAYTLRAALRGQTLKIEDLAPPELRREFTRDGANSRSGDAREFTARVQPVLSFQVLRAKWAIEPPADGAAARAELAIASQAIGRLDDLRSDERLQVVGEIARLWFQLLAMAPPDSEAREAFRAWMDGPDRRLGAFSWVDLGRIAARIPHLQDLAHDLCARSLIGEQDPSESVDHKIEACVNVARALLPLDPLEAGAQFEKAIEIASRLGDEVYDRWDCILKLGDRAIEGQPRRPDLAYRLGRCGETVLHYLDKHFDWTATLRILCGLSPEGGLAVVSRWRDRGVGWFDEVLTDAFEALIDLRQVDGREAAAFIGFEFGWDYPKLLDAALAASSSAERARVVAGFERYLRVRPLAAKTLRKLAEVAGTHGSPAADLNRMAVEAEVEAEAMTRRTSLNSTSQARKEPWTEADWEALFGSDRLDEPEGFAAVLSRADYFVRLLHGAEGFWARACARVPPGRESAFIALALENPILGPHEADSILGGLPSNWKSRLAVRATLKASLERLLRQNHTHVWHNRKYQRISLPMVAAAVGEDIAWPLGVLFDAFAADSAALTSGEAFQLVSLLAMSLRPDEAQEALDFALGLIEATLHSTDGDGPWSSALQPAAGLGDAVAALLWGCLSAPQAKVRWQAAHTVRQLCALDSSPILDRVIGLAEGASVGPFADARFLFYEHNARMWLAIALARAALDNPLSVARFAAFLVNQATTGEPHVLIRHFTQEAALALEAAGAVAFDDPTLAQLRAVNRSPFPVIESDPYKTPRESGPSREWGERRFHFAYDMDRYWFDPLALVFNLTGSAAEEVAEGVVRDDWLVTAETGWKTDARRVAGVFNDHEYGATSHGSRPRVDTLDFYLSFHALMVAAGKLLASRPTHQDHEGTSRFVEWLQLHLLTRDDGRWLSDRRDPVPADVGEALPEASSEDWPYSVTAAELRAVLAPRDGELVVWGFWTNGRDPKDRDVRLSSALVAPEEATSLLRSLQTVDNPRDFRLPDACDSDAEFTEPPFVLKGWIEATDRSVRFDEFDPWAASIPYPPRAPAAFIVSELGLTPDEMGRVWRLAGREAMRAEIWSTGRDRQGYAADEGDRVVVQTDALREMLQTLGRDLIVKVQIDHRRTRDRGDGELEYLYPYFRVFLVRSDGAIHSV
jgi:hypothetical protein